MHEPAFQSTWKEEPQEITGPIYHNRNIFGGRVYVTAFGRHYNDPTKNENWSFDLLKRKKAYQVDCSLMRHLPDIAEQLGIAEIFAPSPHEFNARIADRNDFDVEIPVGNCIVRRSKTLSADGFRLRVGQTYGLSVAGCPVIVAWHPGRADGKKVKVVVAHAGLRSLIDEQLALTELLHRKPESVVENMLNVMGCSGQKAVRRKRVQVVIFFAIPRDEFAYPWDHPEYGENNEKICCYISRKFGRGCASESREGNINLAEIITSQFVALGVPLDNIKLVDPPLFNSDKHPGRGERWYTTRGSFPTHRNLVLVTRLA